MRDSGGPRGKSGSPIPGQLAPRGHRGGDGRLAEGWYLAPTRGGHHQYKHPQKKGLVTIPGSMNDDLAAGTLNSILEQAGLKA
ncbi:MAG TPA: type II toxin-antitoxin system HicA family toxin [Longimicrobiales bacterium]|nr:type II toxin-antitoxin system HicA family toxin [Longimicrobiales bacterium]